MSGEGWPIVKLGDISEVKGGKRLPKNTPYVGFPTGYPYIRLVDIEDGRISKKSIQYIDDQTHSLISRYTVAVDDVCLAIVGNTIGMVFFVDKEWDGANLTENAAKLTNFKKADPKYVYFFLTSIDGQNEIFKNAVGSAQGKLPIYGIQNIDLPLPPLPTQTRIAAILSALDDKIELNRQISATLEAIAQAIFKEWFVDFRYPGATGEMQDSELGPIPKGWLFGTLGDICDLNPRLTLTKGCLAKYVEMKNLSQFSLSIDEPRDREFTSGSKFQNNDTLLARITPCLENGKTGFVDFLDDKEIGWGSTEFIVMRGKNKIGPYFIYCLSRLPSFREFAIQSMVGSSGRQRVVESILTEYPVAIPDKRTSDIYSLTVEKLFLQIKNHSDQSASLSKIRDVLLPKLMSGEIKV